MTTSGYQTQARLLDNLPNPVFSVEHTTLSSAGPLVILSSPPPSGFPIKWNVACSPRKALRSKRGPLWMFVSIR